MAISKTGDPVGIHEKEEKKNTIMNVYQLVNVIELGKLVIDNNENVNKSKRDVRSEIMSQELDQGQIIMIQKPKTIQDDSMGRD